MTNNDWDVPKLVRSTTILLILFRGPDQDHRGPGIIIYGLAVLFTAKNIRIQYTVRGITSKGVLKVDENKLRCYLSVMIEW